MFAKKNWSKLFLDLWIDLPRSLFENLVSGNLSNKNLETRSEHLKILPLSDLVQIWCMYRLDMGMSESGLGQVWIPSQKQICSRPDSDLEQICFCDRIHTCLSPDSDMSMSKRNMHHVWTRSEIGKILRCSDLVSKFL